MTAEEFLEEEGWNVHDNPNIDNEIIGEVMDKYVKHCQEEGQVDAVVMPRSMEEAREQKLFGWNIRCNYCGDYGARWLPGQRPNWGSLCLCKKHEHELDEEMSRHHKEMKRLRTINYEQKRA